MTSKHYAESEQELLGAGGIRLSGTLPGRSWRSQSISVTIRTG